MPKNSAFGLAPEEEKVEENQLSSEKELADEEVDASESEDEDLEDSEEESEEDEGEEEEIVEAPKKKRVSASSKSKKAESTRLPGMEYGLGDVRIDKSIPLSASAAKYMNALLESPLVNAVIPPDMLNEESEQVFCIQSLRFFVPKGTIVRVPLLVADEIRNSFSKRI